MTSICVSGGFDPIHNGHLDMIEAAAKYGRVIVILNSDEWLIRKKKYYFQDYVHRQKIIAAMRYVYTVVSVDDSDGTVCEALQRIRPDYFANGGDRNPENTAELKLCTDLGIKPLFNIGGGKVASSSELVKRSKEHEKVIRPWGSYRVLGEGEGWKTKLITVLPGEKLSRQSHRYRSEHWIVVKGKATTEVGNTITELKISDSQYIDIGQVHRLSNNSDEELEIIEVQIGANLDENDIMRFEDKYGRK